MINALEKGARLLDFEIYSQNNKAVIAAADNPSYKIKDTYNSLSLGEAFNAIQNHAFSSVANTTDPLFLNFRIKSSNTKVLGQLMTGLNILKSRLLTTTYPQFGGHLKMGKLINLPTTFKSVKGKIIIIINIPESAGKYCNGCRGDMSDPSYGNEYINFSDKSPFQFNYRFDSIKNKHNIDMFKNQNKKNIALVYPNLEDSVNNVNWRIPFSYGCQFVLMNYQTKDNFIDDYQKKFATSSFILKPKNLREIPVTIENDNLEDETVGYGPRLQTSEQPLVDEVLKNIGGAGERAAF